MKVAMPMQQKDYPKTPDNDFLTRHSAEYEHYPNETTIKAIEDIENGIGLSRPYDTVEELVKDLMSDD